METRIVISESEASCIKELQELFYLDAEDIENCEIPDLFRSDPDYFNWGLKNHLHKIPFVEVMDKYIIVPDEDLIEAVSDYTVKEISEKCKEMLIRFFERDFRIWFNPVIENTWKAFDGLSFGIAYRGGEGYS